MEEKSYSTVATLLYPDLVMGAVGPAQYFSLIRNTFMESYKVLKNIPIEFIFARLFQSFPMIVGKLQRFLIFQGKTVKKAKYHSFYIIAHEDSAVSQAVQMYIYDPQSNEQTHMAAYVTIVAPGAEPQSVNVFFEDGLMSTIYTAVPQEQLVKIINMYYSYKPKPSSLELATECLSLITDEIPSIPILRELFVQIFRQPDLLYVRLLMFQPFDSKTKKVIAAMIINAHADMMSLNYLINYMIYAYFSQNITEKEILRGDSILTNSLAVIREMNSPHFFEMFAESINKTLSKTNTADEALSSFISEVKTITVPGIIRWVCKLLYDAAKEKFPGTDAPFYAVSGFFFLRSLGPYLLQGENKCNFTSSIISLFNFKKKPEILPYIDSFKAILVDMSKEISEPFMFVRPSNDKLNGVVSNFLELLRSGTNILKNVAEDKELVFEHPYKFFVKKIWDLCELEDEN